MTSLFESMVRARKEHTPWARVNLISFMQEMAYNRPALEGELSSHELLQFQDVILKVHHRHDVSSGFWWTINWTDAEGQRREESSQYFDLVCWRAVEAEMQARDRVERISKKKKAEGEPDLDKTA